MQVKLPDSKAFRAASSRKVLFFVRIRAISIAFFRKIVYHNLLYRHQNVCIDASRGDLEKVFLAGKGASPFLYFNTKNGKNIYQLKKMK